MNMNIVWTAWVTVSLAVFAGFETYALRTGGETLSQFVRNVSASWPLLPVVFGIVVGGLAVHFWWTRGG